MLYNIFNNSALHVYFLHLCASKKKQSTFFMKKVLKHVIITLIFVTLSFASQAAGFMQIRNFPSGTYKGGPQNWTAIQDSVGRLYVGNRDGMLTFDGARWSKYIIPNMTTVRSLMYDVKSGRIYAGASEEFGYFLPDSMSGNLAYHSLMDLFGNSGPNISEVWRIFSDGRFLFFQSDNHIIIYDGNSLLTAESENRISCSAMIGGHLLVGFENGNISELNGTDFTPLPGLESLRGLKIAAILPGKDSIIIATPLNGLFHFMDGKAVRLQTDIDSFIMDNQLFCATNRGSDYVFGTVTGGAVIKNFLTGMTRYVNKESGLLNNTVLNAAFDKAGNIWLCLDNGLDYAVYNSPVSNLIGTANGIGAGYASIKYGSTVYFGTNQGLYSTPYPFQNSPRPLALKRELQGQIWDLTPTDNGFFVAGDAGVFFFSQGKFEKIEGVTGSYTVKPLCSEQALALTASYDGFHMLRPGADASWHNCGLIPGDNGVRGRFCEDSDGILWVGHWLKGIYRMEFDPAHQTFKNVTLFTVDNGLPSTLNNAVALLSGNAVFFNPDGFYCLDGKSGRMIPHPKLTSTFPGVTPRLLNNNNNSRQFILMEDSVLNIGHISDNGELRYESIPIKSLSNKLLNGYETVNYINPQEIIVGNQDGFWNIDSKVNTADSWVSAPFINSIYANSDTLVYRSGLNSEEAIRNLVLPFRLNSLRFEFACPDFSTDESVTFSSRLENYDRTWSNPSVDSSREYTQLAEGKYKLLVRAHNIRTGESAETAFDFEILPPWYRSTTAKALYIIIAIALFVGIGFMTRQWKTNAEKAIERKKETELNAMRQEAEQEAIRKDYEIATLKSEQLEIDIKHKSSELGNATMNLIRKNEILQEIATRIAKIMAITDDNPSVQKQLSHLHSTIEENISHDDDWNTFNRNFDIVYGNYTKRLHETYPRLTQADIRLCCYIKMGLSSKEIAPLINISFKSVEMARYRLRKKINLPSEVSLTDFLTSF